MFFSPTIVYNQTWEDFFVDQEALNISSQDTIVMISSGGCNVLNMVLKSPAKIYAVDNNPAQNYLLRLKIVAVSYLTYRQFWQFFGQAHSDKNIILYQDKLKADLSAKERYFWDNNISLFEKRGLFIQGKLGSLRILRRLIDRLCGKENLYTFLESKNLSDQAKYYRDNIEPKLWRKYTLYMPILTMLLYGVHPRQIYLSIKSHKYFLKDIFKKRLRKMFTTIPINKNYFWHQILLGRYKNDRICPPYLMKENFELLRENVSKIEIRTFSIIDFLNRLNPKSVTKINLSDLPEFLSFRKRTELWKAVVRVAKDRAILIYRSFSPKFFIPKSFHKNFKYAKQSSQQLSEKEMTASYSQVYKYQIVKSRKCNEMLS